MRLGSENVDCQFLIWRLSKVISFKFTLQSPYWRDNYLIQELWIRLKEARPQLSGGQHSTERGRHRTAKEAFGSIMRLKWLKREQSGQRARGQSSMVLPHTEVSSELMGERVCMRRVTHSRQRPCEAVPSDSKEASTTVEWRNPVKKKGKEWSMYDSGQGGCSNFNLNVTGNQFGEWCSGKTTMVTWYRQTEVAAV